MSGISEVLSKRGIAHRIGVWGKELCTMRVGGEVAAVIDPLCTDELIRAVTVCVEEGIRFAVIGKGSNLILGDELSETVVIRTGALDVIRSMSHGRLYVTCGTSLAAVCRRAALEGSSGLSFAAGIPGTLGGGVLMNAGAHGRSLSDVVERATVFDYSKGCIRTLFNHELGFSYRYCNLQEKATVILSAVLLLPSKAHPTEIFAEMQRLTAQRRASQPLELPNAGSIFRRPSPSYPLAALLDRLGLKGLSVGGAAVSEKHAGFIVNTGNATASDVRELIRKIQIIVENECGFKPTPEVRFVPEEL